MQLEKWQITSFVFVSLLVLAAVITSMQGFTEAAVRTYVRDTARTSLVLFLLAFSASSLKAIFPGRWTAWPLRNRRYLGLAFAVSHGLHLLALLTLAGFFPHPFLDDLSPLTLIFGSITYLFILAMSITSFPGPRRWLGERNWSILHTTGSYLIWLIFAQSYVPLAVENAFYVLFAAALFTALGLRLVRFVLVRVGAKR